MSGNDERPRRTPNLRDMLSQEAEFERRVAEKMAQNMRQIYTRPIDRDTRLNEIFRTIDSPLELISARVWLLYREQQARTQALKRTIRNLIRILDQELELYRRTPIYAGDVFE